MSIDYGIDRGWLRTKPGYIVAITDC